MARLSAPLVDGDLAFAIAAQPSPRNIRLGAHAHPAFVHADELIWCGRRGRGPS
jgi:hypothetical protein